MTRECNGLENDLDNGLKNGLDNNGLKNHLENGLKNTLEKKQRPTLFEYFLDILLFGYFLLLLQYFLDTFGILFGYFWDTLRKLMR